MARVVAGFELSDCGRMWRAGRSKWHPIDSFARALLAQITEVKTEAACIEEKLEKDMKQVRGDLEAEGGVYADAFEQLLVVVKVP